MNILLINHYAGSIRHGMEYRPFYLAREWTKHGHHVAIVAASCSHVRTVSPLVRTGLVEEEIEGIQYRWLRTPSYKGNGARRVANMLAFVGQVWRQQSMLARSFSPSLVIASSTYPMDILPARHLAQQVNAALVFEVHDLWPLSLIELGGMSPRHPFVRLVAWAEHYAYRHADCVVSLLPKASDYMQHHGMAPEKFVYIPNGVDVQEWLSCTAPLPEPHQQALNRLRAEGRFIVGYAGAHGVANDLQSLIEAARLAQHEPFAFVLVGQGPEKAGLQERAAQDRLKNVEFLPPAPKSAIPRLLASMDALHIGLMKQPLFRFGVSPNKLIDYMMAGRPVISAMEAGNDMVADSGCGISIPPSDPESIVRSVQQLASLPPEALASLGESGRRYALANHDYRVLASRFLDAIGEFRK